MDCSLPGSSVHGIFQVVVTYTVKGFGVVNKTEVCLLDPKGAQAPRELSAVSGDIPRVTPGELLLEQWVETTVVVSSPHAQDGPWVRSTGAEMPRRIPPGPLVPPWAGAGAGRDVSSHLDFLCISVFYPKNALSL